MQNCCVAYVNLLLFCCPLCSRSLLPMAKFVLFTKFFKIYVETYECESVHHSFIVK